MGEFRADEALTASSRGGWGGRAWTLGARDWRRDASSSSFFEGRCSIGLRAGRTVIESPLRRDGYSVTRNLDAAACSYPNQHRSSGAVKKGTRLEGNGAHFCLTTPSCLDLSLIRAMCRRNGHYRSTLPPVKTTSVGEKIRAALPDAKPSATIERTVRDWLLADQDFNVWFLETTKGTLDDAKLMALLGGYGEDQDAVGRAWDAFEIERDEAALAAVLAASKERMAALKLK
jgi:hypothetical protein